MVKRFWCYCHKQEQWDFRGIFTLLTKSAFREAHDEKQWKKGVGRERNLFSLCSSELDLFFLSLSKTQSHSANTAKPLHKTAQAGLAACWWLSFKINKYIYKIKIYSLFPCPARTFPCRISKQPPPCKGEATDLLGLINVFKQST